MHRNLKHRYGKCTFGKLTVVSVSELGFSPTSSFYPSPFTIASTCPALYSGRSLITTYTPTNIIEVDVYCVSLTLQLIIHVKYEVTILIETSEN